MEFFQMMKYVQTATVGAKERTGRPLGVEVKKGEYRVVEVFYRKNGSSVVLPLKGYDTLDNTVRFLNNLEAA